MRTAALTTTPLILVAMILAGCGGGDSATPAAVVSAASCRYGTMAVPKAAITATAPDLKIILTECEFNRLYRGNPDLKSTDPNDQSQYNAVMYTENPGQIKSKTSYAYYSYANFVTAYNDLFSAGKAAAYAPFAASGDYMSNMREMAAFLANIGQETNGNSAAAFKADYSLAAAGSLGNGYGLYAVTEGSCASLVPDPTTGIIGCPGYGTKRGYCTGSGPGTYPGDCASASAQATSFCQLAAGFCASPLPTNDNLPSSQYFGRGGKQISYPYNYMYYGSKIHPDDPYKLGNNPSLIDTNGQLGWETALAYWALPYEDISSTKPSMHDGFFSPTKRGIADFDSLVGFGKTVNLINGGVECGKTYPYMKVQTLNRINNYVELLLLNDHLMPIKTLEVTHGAGAKTQVDVYTKDQLIHNISTLGVTFIGYSYVVPPATTTGPVATDPATIPPHLLKQYGIKTAGGSVNAATAVYTGAPPQQAWWGAYGSWGGAFYYGRYNSQPLIQEYYAQPNSVIVGDQTRYMTDITKVMLYYDAADPHNVSRISDERLDCTGVTNFAGG